MILDQIVLRVEVEILGDFVVAVGIQFAYLGIPLPVVDLSVTDLDVSA